MQQRVQIFHRRDTPSSATQLPIMTALHAEDLTLFVPILQDMASIVKPLFFPFGIFCTNCTIHFSVLPLPAVHNSTRKQKFLLGKPKQMCYDIK